MTKELFISSSPHETKVALVEDDQLVEVYYQRDTDVGLVGGIYKGRVSRVLPGMQSAFVNIGLERDAFLYVSDFLEDAEEYDRVFSEAETRVARYTEGSEKAAAPPPVEAATAAGAAIRAREEPSFLQAAEGSSAAPAGASTEVEQSETAAETPPARVSAPAPTAIESGAPTTPLTTAPPPHPRHEPEHRHFEQRGRRRRRRGRGFRESRFARPESHVRSERQEQGGATTFEVLPGESLAKYSQTGPPGGTTGLTPLQSVTESTAVERANYDVPEAVTDTLPAVSRSQAAGQVEEAPMTAPTRHGLGRTVGGLASAGHTTEAVAHGAPEATPAVEPARESTSSAVPVPAARLDLAPEAEEHATSKLPAAVETEKPLVQSEFADAEAGDAELPEGMVEDDYDDAGPADEAPAAQAVDLAGSVVEESTGTEHTGVDTATPGGDRSYTLRETSQRPRFAPRRGRRGRGRFGRRGGRPEGGSSSEPSRAGNTQSAQIAELLKEGQEILVQIAKEPLGSKGARITSHIALPGRYLVYMPTISHIGVSRKIASEEERFRLRNIILENRGSLTGGFIVRTAGAGRPEEELKADLQFLSSLWNDIRARAERIKAPALLHSDLTLVERILRDVLSPDFKTVRVDNELEYERAVEFVSRCQPSLVGHVKLHTRDTPVFEEFGIQQEIDKALKPKVWLKSGGYIVINQTEALVAIDVNTGKYVGKTNRLEDTIVKTNVDAVQEIVRQIRLRDLGGIIVIDFIDMDDRRNRQKVVQALEEALRADRAPTKILSINEFGLVALTRKRVKQSLERTLCQPCPYCGAAGWVKSVNTVCNEILAEARKMAHQIDGDTMTLRLSPEVARALKSREGALLSELESATHKDIIIKSDPNVHQEQFEIF